VEKVIMAGMFYSLQEAAEKLGKTEDEVRKLGESGKLRLFRDGSNLLFKIEEVNTLAAERLDDDLGLGLEPAEPGTDIFTDAQEPTAEDLMLDLGEETAAAKSGSDADLDIGSALDFKSESAEESKAEPPAELDAESELDLEAAPAAEPQAEAEVKPAAEADASSELGLAPEEDQPAGAMEGEPTAPVQEQPKEAAAAEEDISLASESGLAAGSDITDMDTALTGEGVNVLGDTSTGAETSGDSSAETVAPAGESTEASLEEIEEDVNLDSFGSGSGLLDLSLQADDTSLGGILDEIYTSEGGEEGKAAATPGSVEDISAEVDHVTADTTELVSAPEAVMPMTAVAATTFMEVPPDRASNIFGMLLFLPLLALLYTAIIAWAALCNAKPSILGPVQSIVWYIVGGAVVITGLVAAVAFTSGRERKPAAPKAKQEKKEKPGKKDKVAKKEEASEPAKKEAKPKKSFLSFGKKK
jgi:excisionase family DNA binding protein